MSEERPASSLLLTDGYKFPMMEAGAPLREEEFYYSHRKGGWSFIPLDIGRHIRSLLPLLTLQDPAFETLANHGYALGAGARTALTLRDQVRVRALPKGSWFTDREPVFSVAGPSALGSILEPLALQLHRRIQIATCARLRPDELPRFISFATCEADRQITLETLDEVEVQAPPIKVVTDLYVQSVYDRAMRMVEIVEDPDRLFEVGLRAASCPEEHSLALSALAEAGIRRTSNVLGALQYGMIPVGTMGHEHIMRFGTSYDAFAAMRDRVPGFVSYLPDTYSTLAEGVPAALRAMAEAPGRDAAIRFDSEANIRSQYAATVCMANEAGLSPRYILESGWDDEKTIEFEALRRSLKVPAERQAYGLGNFFVKPPWAHFGRDHVSAVYKLSYSSEPCMKMGDEPQGGKASLPGKLVLWRPALGADGYRGPSGYVSQFEERWQPPGWSSLLTGAGSSPRAMAFSASEMRGLASRPYAPLGLSPETQRRVAECHAQRRAAIAEAQLGRSTS